MSEHYLVLERSDGSVVHLAVQTRIRAPSPPTGPGWSQDASGYWNREITAESLAAEVRREESRWIATDGLTLVSWRTLSVDEHEKFNEYRHHRDAMELVGGVIQHNMPKARELHRHLLRHQRAEKLLILDAAYNGAVAQGDTPRAAEIEARRAALRDLTSDPRIESAKDVTELAQVGFTEDGEAALNALRAELRRA
jgi:hypothetical protein